MKTFVSQTREGFRLIVAWVAGFFSFSLLSGLSERAISYFQPWTPNNVVRSEAELVVLLCLIGVGILGLAGTLILEGLAVRQK